MKDGFLRDAAPTRRDVLLNDLELHGLHDAPAEMKDLAAVKGHHDELVASMNDKLNAVMDAEIGTDDGRP